MDEGIVLQNEHLQDWLVSRLKEGDFEGDSEALAKYILALLETYALDSTDEKANFASNKTIRGKCVDDLNDFLADKTPVFVDELFNELEKNPLKTSVGESEATIPSAGAKEGSPVVVEEEEEERERDEEDGDWKRRRTERFGKERTDDRKENSEPLGSHDTQRGARNRDRDGRDSRENRDGDRRRWRNDGSERRGSSSGKDFDRGSKEGNKAGTVQGPFPPPMPMAHQFPPGFMEMMAFAAASGNGTTPAAPPPNPFLGVPFPAGPFIQNTQTDAMGMSQDMSAFGGQARRPVIGEGFNGSGRGRGRGGTQRPVTGGDASSNRVNLSQSRSTLYVRNLPPEKLTMPEISQYFSKFGTVTNIQLRPATNPDRAFVEFATPEEAQQAMNSVEAVMGNRHVRLNWARDSDYSFTPNFDVSDPNQGNVDQSKGFNAVQPKGSQFPTRGGRGRGRRGRGRGEPTNTGGANRADFLGQQGAANVEEDNDGEKETNMETNEEDNKETAEEINARKRKEVLAAREEQKRQKLNREKEETEQKKKILAEQKRILEMLEAEKDTMSPETRRQHLQELKTVAEKLQPTKLSTKHSQISTSGSGSKLDALQAKLSALKKEAKDLGIDSNFTPGGGRGFRGGYRGRGAPYHFRGTFRGRGRGRGRGFGSAQFSGGNMSLDLRPRVLIMDGSVEDSAATRTRIRGMFQNVETIEKGEDDLLHVKFQSRTAAETAMKQGASQLGSEVSLRWPDELKGAGDGGGFEQEGEEGGAQEDGDALGGPELHDDEEIVVDYEDE